jgi:archaellum biogenesis protein FlaJ (TadC family)
MEMFLKIVVAGVLVMMLFFLWPTVKNWQENGPKAQRGDWLAVALPLGGVVLLVVLLVLMVR